jgi:hypothetical protein
MRDLTDKEIEELASRRGVKRIAVENFLSTLGSTGSKLNEIRNLYMDAGSYRWNTETQVAILEGIELVYKEG